MARGDELIGTTEVAEQLGVTRQRVHQLLGEFDDFPAPAAELPRAKLWRRRDIDRWAKRYGYPKEREQ